jgi:hypothetical protein
MRALVLVPTSRERDVGPALEAAAALLRPLLS